MAQKWKIMLIFRKHGKIWFNVPLSFYWMHGSDREKFSPIVNQQGFDCVWRGPKMGQERSNQKDFEKNRTKMKMKMKKNCQKSSQDH